MRWRSSTPSRRRDLGIVCVRQVVLPTEAAADEVVDELADGATIADLVDRSIDEASKANGGEVQGDDGAPCVVTPPAATVLGSEVVLALADAEPGDIVGPVQGAAGWHVAPGAAATTRSADAVNGLVQQSGGQLPVHRVPQRRRRQRRSSLRTMGRPRASVIAL